MYFLLLLLLLRTAANFSSSIIIPSSPASWNDKGVAWCADGLAGALERSIRNLLRQNITADKATLLKTRWFQANDPHRRLRGEARLLAENTLDAAERALQRAASPVEALMPMIPIVRAVLTQGATGTQADKLSSYAESVCRLSDVETELASETSLSLLPDILGQLLPSQYTVNPFKSMPYTCLVVDVIYSILVCEMNSVVLDKLNPHMPSSKAGIMGAQAAAQSPIDSPWSRKLGVEATPRIWKLPGSGDVPDTEEEDEIQLNFPLEARDITFPGVKTADDCDAVLKDFPDNARCRIAPGILQYSGLAGFSDGDKVFSWSDPSLHLDLPLMHYLSATGVVPRYISEEVRSKELLTYLALFRAIQIGSRRAMLDINRKCIDTWDKKALTMLVPGWPLAHSTALQQTVGRAKIAPAPSNGYTSGGLADLLHPGSPSSAEATPVDIENLTVPFVFYAESGQNPCETLIVIRGSHTPEDLAQAFDWFKVPGDGLLPGSGHSGLLSILEALLPDAQRFLSEKKCKCEDQRVIVTGHSLGAATAQYLSLALARWRDCRLGSVDGVYFSPFRVFDEEQRDAFIRQVNGRTIIDVNDMLHYMPCSTDVAKHGMPSCTDSKSTGVFHAVQHPVPSFPSDFVDHYGLILTDVAPESSSESESSIFSELRQTYPFAMAVLSALLDKRLLSSVPSVTSLLAPHLCGPACALSAACITSSPLAAGEEQFRWLCESCERYVSSVESA